METAALAGLCRWFAGYAKSFYSDDTVIQPMIVQKEEHSFIVAGHSRDLALSLGLAADEVRLAEAVGLCHDTGRFRQATIYRTFRDRESIDHGRLGVDELTAEGIPARLAPRDWETLAFAVRWHNAVSIPAHDDPRHILFAKLIRDTDKLDICRVLPPAPPADGCSPGLTADFLAGRLLFYEDMKTADDRKLVMLSWLFDIHFPWTVREIVRRGYIERLLAALPPSPELPAIRRFVRTAVAAKLSG